MYKYQTLPKNEIINILLLFADRISCSYCPCENICEENKNIPCETLLKNYLVEEIKQPKDIEYYDGFNEGFNAGYEACKKAIIDKLQKGRIKNNEDSR